MAVYTKVTPAEASAFLQNFDLGAFQTLEPIREGVENTNYFVTAGNLRYVLTLFEKRVRAEDLSYYLELKTALAAKNFPCPRPLADRAGKTAHMLNEKPAALVSFLNGKGAASPSAAQCFSAGQALARMHLLSADFSGRRENGLSYAGCAEIYRKIAPRLSELGAEKTAFTETALQEFQSLAALSLPRGHIHADYFPDNVLFDGDQLTGVIDFYFACDDYYMYDLAIAFSAWCFDGAGEYHASRGEAMLRGYAEIRMPGEAEIAAFAALSRASAIRFFLTRAHDWLFHNDENFVTPKNPEEYYRVYQQWLNPNFQPWRGALAA